MRSFPILCALLACVALAPAQTYFFETFDDNSNGWTLGTEWGIGPAMASTGSGNPDPDTDAAGVLGGGVAGVVIGGNATTTQHDFYWIESPPSTLRAPRT